MFEPFFQELADKGSVQFYVRARPGMAQTKAVSMMDDESIKIDIAAAPEGGKANVELIKYLEKEFGATVQIVSGATARMKLVRVSRS